MPLLLKKLRWFSLYREMNLYSQHTGVRRKKIFSAISKRAFPTVYQSLNSNNQMQNNPPVLISQDFANKTNVYSKLKSNNVDITNSSIVDAFQVRKEWFENGLYWNTYGTSATKLSLRYSLWNRDPTNDLRVIKFCLSVPEEQFVQNGVDRSLIRRSTKNYLT